MPLCKNRTVHADLFSLILIHTYKVCQKSSAGMNKPADRSMRTDLIIKDWSAALRPIVCHTSREVDTMHPP